MPITPFPNLPMSAAVTRWLQLIEQQPNHELARFSLGKALFDAGEFTAAKEHFQIALVKKPDWMVVQILLGKCDLALGDKPSAKAAFQRALQLALSQHHEGPQAEMEAMLADLA